MNELYIGSSPVEENCAQVGSDNYMTLSRKECRAYINQLERELGKPPFGCRLIIKNCPHDFGNYLEVVAMFEDDNKEARDYAFKCESNGPTNWDDKAKQELGINN